jgi:hypothetical protein
VSDIKPREQSSLLCNPEKFEDKVDLSIDPLDLQLKINSEQKIPSDFFYVKSYIGFLSGVSQHVILMNENGNKFHAAGKAV